MSFHPPRQHKLTKVSGNKQEYFHNQLFVNQNSILLNNHIETAFSASSLDELAKQTKFVVRNRKITPSCFVNTLMFNSLSQSQTSLPDLTDDLSQNFGIEISKEATDKTPINWNKISRKFNKSKTSVVEMDVLIYEKELLPCRLILEPVSKKEYDKRIKSAKSKAKSWGVGISKLHKVKCRYNMFITNIEKEKLSLDKVRKTYYLRWQIELVFKTWKSFFKINEVKKVKKERLECQIWAKLIWILLNWRLFQACNIYLRRTNTQKTMSLLKFFKNCIKFSQSFRNVILGKLTLDNWILESFLPLISTSILEAPKDKQTHYQILINNLYA